MVQPHQRLILLLQGCFSALLKTRTKASSSRGSSTVTSWNTAYQLGNKPKAHQIVRLHKAQKILAVFLRLLAQLCAKAQRRVIRALLDMLFKAIEGTAADKQDIFCVYLNKLLLAGACGRRWAARCSPFPPVSSKAPAERPSPPTSRVMEGFSLLRVILSISSM